MMFLYSHIGGEQKIEIANDVLIASKVLLDYNGGLKIEEQVVISENVVIFTHDHTFKDRGAWFKKQAIEYHPKIIKKRAWIGTNAIILGKATIIDEGAVVAAGAVVTKSVPDFTVVAGNPAKIIKVIN